MEAFGKGDEREFAKVFNHFYSTLVYFASQIVGEENDAEDIVVIMFEKLWKIRAEFTEPNKIKAFLYVSIKNACYNRLRAIKVRYLSHAEIKHLSDSHYQDFVFGAMVKSELLMNVYHRLKQLSPQQLEIIKLKFVEGKRNNEIADMLHLSVSTVKTQQGRALIYLRRAL